MNTCIVGLGIMGKRHVSAAQSLGVDVSGICELNRIVLESAVKEFGLSSEKAHINFDEMLNKIKPEILVIATTAPSHCELTCKAAESGVKYILCEKPMAVSIKECNRMIEACENNGAKLAVNHQMRFLGYYIKAKQIINSAEFGGLGSITVLGGNIGLSMNATHYFEMFRYLSDENSYEVTAWLSENKVPNPRGAQFEDRGGSIRVTTKSGKRLYIEIGTDQGHGKNTIIMGKHGQLIIDELTGKLNLTVRNETSRNLPTTRYASPSNSSVIEVPPLDALEPTKSVLKALINSEDYPTGEDGRNTVAIAVAAHYSNENEHRSIILDEMKNNDRKFPWA